MRGRKGEIMALPYSQYYIQDLQGMKDRIENQIRQYQQQQQAPITQNFQITPTNTSEIEGKYATNIDEVRNTFVIKTGLFVDRDFNTLWVKDVSGRIRTFTLQEVVELDEKDKEILELKKQIEEMRGKINEYDDTNFNEPIKDTKPKRIPTNKPSHAK
jgi:predicted  nucleic acid-binding Zn-ribbon protein